MGFVRKLTGADQAKKQVAALKEQTQVEEAALREQGNASVRAASMAAKQASDQIAAEQARSAAEAKAVNALNAPLEQADVLIQDERAAANGATAYLVKPFSPLELLTKVEELCRTTSTLASEAGVGPAPAAVAAAGSSPRSSPAVSGTPR